MAVLMAANPKIISMVAARPLTFERLSPVGCRRLSKMLIEAAVDLTPALASG